MTLKDSEKTMMADQSQTAAVRGDESSQAPANLPPIRTLLYDLGNVLVNFSHDRMFAQVGQLCGLPGPEVRQRVIASGWDRRFDQGRCSPAEFHAACCELVGHPLPEAALNRAVSDIFFDPTPAMMALLPQLKQLGVRLVLLSNTNLWHVAWIRQQWSVLNAFDHLVLSYEAQAVKPEPAIFQAALAAIDCPPENCFYTDDIAEYIAAGRAHGLQAEVFTTPAAHLAELRRRGLAIAG